MILKKIRELEERVKAETTRKQQEKIFDELTKCIDECEEASMRLSRLLDLISDDVESPARLRLVKGGREDDFQNTRIQHIH
jgi:RNAse (barnase) inhibitor barstar